MFVHNTISVHVYTCICVTIVTCWYNVCYLCFSNGVASHPISPPLDQPLYNDIQVEIAMPVMSTDKQTGSV